MGKIILESIEGDLQEKLKDKEFRKFYEMERAKVALAQKIAQMRQEKKLKQADLAKKMHVSQQFISQIETAQEKNLTLDTLLKIAKSLDRGIRISFPKISKRDSYLTVE